MIAADDPARVAALAAALVDAGDVEAGVEILDRAVRATDRPDPVLATNLARLIWPTGAVERAATLLEDAATAAPGKVAIWVNLGDVRSALDDPHAESAYRRALCLAPAVPEIHWSLATDLLVRGQADRAWPHYHWRHRDPRVRQRPTPFPRLVSIDRLPPRVLVWSNEGVGEDLRYAGLLPVLAAAGTSILFETDPRLVPLFRRSFPSITVVGRAWPPASPAADRTIDAHASLGDLWPLLAGGGAAPVARGYLRADPAAVAALRARYRALGEGPVVGLSWMSRRTPFARSKSVDLAALAPLLARPAVFVALQYGDDGGDGEPKGLYRDRAIDPLVDLDGFAAQVAAMDLVVTSSSTTAHMAGALDVPAWVMVHRGPPITPYWQAGRPEVDWYPRMRVRRQAVPGHWTDVVAGFVDEFDAWLAGRRPPMP